MARVKSIIIVGLLFALVAIIGCKGNKEEHPLGPKTEQKSKSEQKRTEQKEITIAQWGHTKYLIYLPLYVAMDKGFFQEEGLKINLKYAGNDDVVFASVVGGSALAGIGDPVFAYIAKEKRGFDGLVVTWIVDRIAVWGIAKSPKKIDTVKDLSKFKTIATFPAPSTTYTVTKNLIKQAGLSVNIKESPIDTQLSLLQKGIVDAVMLLEPAASIAEVKYHYHVVFSLPKFGGKFAFTGLTTTRQIYSKNKDVFVSLVKGLDKAFKYIYNPANRDELVNLAIKEIPSLSKEVASRAIDRLIKDDVFPRRAGVDIESWRKALEIRVEVGDIKGIKDAEQTLIKKFLIK